MAETQRREMTVEEFLQWCLTQEDRYELVDGYPVPLRAMSGASDSHDAIAVNLIIELGNQLKGTDCRPSIADKALRTSIKKVRRPDVTVECSDVDPKFYESRNPVVVFEILSPTTSKHDRSVKLQEYMRHPTLKTIVHIDPDKMDVLVVKRGSDDAWSEELLNQPKQKVGIAGTPAKLALRDIYARVPIPPPVAPPGTRTSKRKSRT